MPGKLPFRARSRSRSRAQAPLTTPRAGSFASSSKPPLLDDEIVEFFNPSTRSSSSRRQPRRLAAVVIPSSRSSIALDLSATNSPADSTGLNTERYDTPASSVDNISVNMSGSRRSKRPMAFKLGGRSILAGSKRKRSPPAPATRPSRRSATQARARIAETAGDAKLAAALQAEEYGAQPSLALNGGKMKDTIGVGDISDNSDYLSDLSALSDIASDEFEYSDVEDMEPKSKIRRGARAADVASMALDTESEAVATDSASSEEEPRQAATRPRPRRVRPRFSRFRGMGRKEARRAKLEAAHPEIKSMWKDLESLPVIKPVAAKQPASINRSLKPFQLEGLDWMIKQEKTCFKGGLLGDEMGMGKTIQAVSLIMSDHPAKDPTLVLCPPVALMQWQNEINSYTDGKLKVLVIHGSNSKSKNLTAAGIKKYDVLLMSYNSLESMHRKQEKGWKRDGKPIKEKSPVHAVHYHRLILDEAHSIKSRQTGSAQACFALKGTYKWCLSGTPVQNRIGEFFSLLRFLEVRPFAAYFCDNCDCSSLHWTIKDYYCTRKECRHSASEHRSVFNEEILTPITENDPFLRDEALRKLHLITSRIMLRRMKKDHTSSMELPPKQVVLRNEFFSAVERDFSTSIMTNTNREFDTYVSRGVVLNNYANIFGLIMQMRQVANHPDLLLKRKATGGSNVLVCHICDEVAEEPIISRCKHEFCRSCAKQLVQSCTSRGKELDCPRCHLPLSIDLDQPSIEQETDAIQKSSIINRISMDNWTSSTKIELLIYELYRLRSSTKTIKSIIFSQFTSMLQLVEWRLRRAGITTVMLDGSMSPVQRQRSIDYFMKNVKVEVFLVSLKAGGVALNLTEASRVFIVDPWWNPSSEWQSADRCHRIGQTRPCTITRLIIEDSVESRMVQLQEKKAKMVASTVDNDKVAIEKLSPEDMQFLFKGN